MKSNTNKKTRLVVMLTTLLWLPLKTFWESRDDLKNTGKQWFWRGFSDYWGVVQTLYWVPPIDVREERDTSSPLGLFASILVIVTFLVWVVSFFRIWRIKDKDLKRKNIKISLWIISILILIIVLISLYIWMVNTDIIDELF